MGQPLYILDSNIVIDYIGNHLPNKAMNFMHNIIDVVPIISVVTKIEVLGFNAPKQNYQLLIDFMNDATILDLSNDVVDACIELRKLHKTKLPDAIIAATAIAHNLTLITRNTNDFKGIDNLKVLNVWDI